MKNSFRNLLSVFRRFKMATVLNILGLSVAFTAFTLIMMQLDYDLSFDRCHPNADRIYRVNISEISAGSSGYAIVSRPVGEHFIQSSPHIEAGVLLYGLLEDITFSVTTKGERHSYTETSQRTTESLIDVFHFDMIEGDTHALSEPASILLPQSIAKKVFGNEPAIGKTVQSQEGDFVVGGVYKDFPKNSSLLNVVYKRMADDFLAGQWGNFSLSLYFRLDDPANAGGIIDNFKKSIDSKPVFGVGTWEEAGEAFTLSPLLELHYPTGVLYDLVPKTSRQTLLLLFGIAVLILLIAGINFTNFSMAMAPVRIKNINTRKVLGADQSNLRLSLLAEAVIVAFVSFLVSLLLVGLFANLPMANLVDANVALNKQVSVVLLTLLIAVVTGIISGIYPAYYMTSFEPALVLKGSFGLSPKGRKLRNGLIAVQFAASFTLIIGASFMYLQNRYMQQSSLGYDKDQLIVSTINPVTLENYKMVESELKSFAGVEEVSYAAFLLSSGDSYSGMGNEYSGQQVWYQCIMVYPSFMKTIGVELTEGRDFLEGDTKEGALIFNELARTKYGLELGGLINGYEPVVGFMPDVKFASFRKEVEPMAFLLLSKEEEVWLREQIPVKYLYVRVKAGSDMVAAIKHIENSLRKIDIDHTYDARFYDDVLNTTYEQERKLNSLITLFSLIAIFLSIMGVFGMVVFESEMRRREIGIRKVFGSSSEEILLLFNKTYIRILCGCFVLAAPVAWYAIDKWLENFAYKTPMYWWVYLLAFAVVLVVTVGTVTFQSWRAANLNPTESMRPE